MELCFVYVAFGVSSCMLGSGNWSWTFSCITMNASFFVFIPDEAFIVLDFCKVIRSIASLERSIARNCIHVLNEVAKIVVAFVFVWLFFNEWESLWIFLERPLSENEGVTRRIALFSRSFNSACLTGNELKSHWTFLQRSLLLLLLLLL